MSFLILISWLSGMELAGFILIDCEASKDLRDHRESKVQKVLRGSVESRALKDHRVPKVYRALLARLV